MKLASQLGELQRAIINDYRKVKRLSEYQSSPTTLDAMKRAKADGVLTEETRGMYRAYRKRKKAEE